jgi:hypothetical protein
MVTIHTSLPRVLLLLLLLAAKTGYDYYKVFAWPQTSATLISARQTCEMQRNQGDVVCTANIPSAMIMKKPLG